MKKLVSLALVIVLSMGLIACAWAEETHGNYTDEMKIPRTVNLSEEDGADFIERLGDHVDSPYFSHLDFYNMPSNDTLTILPKFKTQQQSSEWACGVTAAVMVLNYFDKLGDHNEETLAACRPEGLTTKKGGLTPSSTSLRQMISVFENVGGFELTSTYDLGDEVYEKFTLAAIRDYLKDGQPILVCWNDWHGHWQVIIGYDTMGTDFEYDDVLIMADPYDTTDHNQDGYGVYGAQRFYYNFTSYNIFNEEDGNDMLFLIAKPTA